MLHHRKDLDFRSTTSTTVSTKLRVIMTASFLMTFSCSIRVASSWGGVNVRVFHLGLPLSQHKVFNYVPSNSGRRPTIPCLTTTSSNSRRGTTSSRSRSSSTTSSRFAETTTSSSSTSAESTSRRIIPITLLSGFLGSGKTSTLQNLLQNTGGYKVGVVINDVASVNIDAKYILSSFTAVTETTNHSITTPLSSLLLESSDVVELQNGCACCSLSDELLSSIQTLLTAKNTTGNNPQPRNLDAIVVELSGVADPTAIKQRWMELEESTSAPTLLRLTNISRVVTLVDSSTFGSDYMSWNTAGDREGWKGNNKNNKIGQEDDECSANRKISELLVEQVEAADTILINKVDLTTADQVSLVTQVTRGLNTAAKIYETQHGKVPHHMILGNTDSTITQETYQTTIECNDSTHHHLHHHDHDHRSVSTSTITTTTACSDPTCTDPTHDHSTHHNHNHNSISSKNTSLKNLGIGSFVFKASVPFHSGRLMDLLNKWPVPVKDTLDVELLQEASRDGYTIRGQKIFGNSIPKESIISPFVGVLRSKGFCWLAPTSFTEYDLWRHDTAMYWSHAGKHFSITAAGTWWGSLSKEKMKTYFEEKKNPREYNRILTEDFVSEEWGDRRQELVFIGTNLNETKINSSLQACLLSTDEMKVYREQLKGILPDRYIP